MSEPQAPVYTAEQEEQNKLKRAYLDGYYKGCQDTQKAAPRWVRCDERLPDTPRMVIAYVDQWHIFAAYHSSRGEWKQADGFTVIGVTHWMPIEPPKEDA